MQGCIRKKMSKRKTDIIMYIQKALFILPPHASTLGAALVAPTQHNWHNLSVFALASKQSERSSVVGLAAKVTALFRRLPPFDISICGHFLWVWVSQNELDDLNRRYSRKMARLNAITVLVFLSTLCTFQGLIADFSITESCILQFQVSLLLRMHIFIRFWSKIPS